MKHSFSVLFITTLTIFVFAGCSSTTATLTAQTGNSENDEIAYSNVFDGKAMIVPETIGLYVLMELEEKEFSAMHKLRQSTGTLGSADITSKGNLFFFLVNTTDKPLELYLNKVQAANWLMVEEPVHLVIPAGEALRQSIGQLSTSWYKTEMPIEFSFSFTGKTGGGTLILNRLTDVELAEMQKKLSSVQNTQVDSTAPID